jgi:hypothetical protein
MMKTKRFFSPFRGIRRDPWPSSRQPPAPFGTPRDGPHDDADRANHNSSGAPAARARCGTGPPAHRDPPAGTRHGPGGIAAGRQPRRAAAAARPAVPGCPGLYHMDGPSLGGAGRGGAAPARDRASLRARDLHARRGRQMPGQALPPAADRPVSRPHPAPLGPSRPRAQPRQSDGEGGLAPLARGAGPARLAASLARHNFLTPDNGGL